MKGVEKGLDQKTIWDTYAGINLVDASYAHSYYILYECFMEKVNKVSNVQTKKVLTKLLLSFGI